jgi:hypothetical protein
MFTLLTVTAWIVVKLAFVIGLLALIFRVKDGPRWRAQIRRAAEVALPHPPRLPHATPLWGRPYEPRRRDQPCRPQALTYVNPRFHAA